MSKSLKFYGLRDTDRISSFPEDLIGNILSFLPTKEAVATSVLSTKWKWSWTFVTRLDFTDQCLSVAHSEDQVELLKASFTSFVYRVLLYRKPTPLNYLGFNCGKRYYASHVRAWVSAALSVGLKELDMSIHLKEIDPPHVLPSELFSCKSLVKLKLGCGFRIYVPPIVCLPSLEVLTLCDVGFQDDDSVRRFFIGCPVLEKFESDYRWNTLCVLPLEFFTCRKLVLLKLSERFVLNLPALVSLPNLEVLHLSGTRFPDNESFKRFFLGCPSLQELNMMTYDATVLHIDAPRLSSLTISFQSHKASNGKVVLDTPSLEYLNVNGMSADSLEVTDLSRLVEADISDQYVHMQYQVASNLILALSKVQTLRFCRNMIEVIAKHGCKLPKFDKMTTLKLGASHKVGWTLLPDLLENSPVLETLVFQDGLKGIPYSRDPTPTWHAPQRVPYCLTHHLKVIQVNCFQGDIEEDEMIWYFIENRGVLKDLTIQHCPGSGDFWDADIAEW